MTNLLRGDALGRCNRDGHQRADQLGAGDFVDQNLTIPAADHESSSVLVQAHRVNGGGKIWNQSDASAVVSLVNADVTVRAADCQELSIQARGHCQDGPGLRFHPLDILSASGDGPCSIACSGYFDAAQGDLELVAVERRYGVPVEELLSDLPSFESDALDLDSSDEQIEKLETQLRGLESKLQSHAAALTAERLDASSLLSSRVSEELAQLAMSGARLEIQVTPGSDFDVHGADKIEFLLAAHSGADPRALSKGASGGELSRIMLAIELVLVAGQQLPTMIFDEVDAGVGGQAAVELGRRLKKLAESTQVIVVTHLPQVAAFADRQIRVSKDVSGEITESSVELLSDTERQTELARMLSGNPDSEVALEHAKELLDSAR